MITINNTVPGVIQGIEVKGNTYQDPNNLSKIVSAGIDNGDGTYKMSILSCGENLFNKSTVTRGKYISYIDGTIYDNETLGYSEYIKIDSTKQMFSTSWRFVAYYDNAKKFISGEDNVSTDNKKLSIPLSAKYLRITYRLSALETSKLQEGTVATPYTPYQETRCDIKLPCQLEGNKERSDLLYFDNKLGAWCVDKVVKTWKWTDTTYYEKSGSTNTPGLFPFYIRKAGLPITSYPISNCFKYVYNWNSTETCFYVGTNEIVILLKEDMTKEDFKTKYFNKFMIKYVGDAEKIILPQSEQIKLNSFANKTHIYTISGEVDATVKATVSKSLASTVQANTNEINILNGKIADIKGLKETQDFSYEADKGYLVCKDTQNGVVKDLKLYGKSLVNLCNNDYTKSNTGIYYHTINKSIFPFGEDVTIKVFKENDSSLQYLKWAFYAVDEQNNAIPIKGYTSDFSQVALNIKDAYKSYRLYLQSHDGTQYVDFDRTKVKACIVKGNVEINSYFEGIASVGNGNEIEVLSRKEDGNLFDGILELGKILTSNGTDYSDLNTIRSKNKIFLKIGTYYLNGKGSKPGNFFKYDINGNYLGWGVISSSNGVFSIDVDCFVRFQVVETNLIDLNLSINKTITSYTPLEIDKKTILFKDVDNTWKPILNLRGIDENNCDIIDSVNNNFENKVGLTVLNGTETKWLTRNQPTDTNLFRIGLNLDGRYKKGSSLICDKFINEKESYEKEGISIHSADGNLDIVINKSKASSVETIKQYLQTNNISFIGILSEPKQYEINPIFPESYDNETMILFGSGVIAPRAEWKIASHAANIIKNQGQRLTRLEDDFYKYTVVQNRIMLDSRYAADSATFKVDTSIYNANNATTSNFNASICAAKEIRKDVKYDFDLYKLIKRNILVGKDNYDKTWMEECMTFYWMDFKISDEMYSELNQIIKNQYNPPIDITPIEPSTEEISQI